MKTELVGIAGLRLIAVVAAFVEPLFPADVDLVDQQEAADIVVRFAVAGRVVHRAAEAVDLDLRDNREHILGIGGLCKVGRLCDDHHSVPCAVADLCSGDFAVDVNVALEEVVHDVDVTLDNYTELFPLLQKYNAKATIFVIPKAIGTPHKMTAEQVQELSRSGLVSIQSHTYSHGNLSTMDEQTLIFEMEQSQNYLAALTGQVPYAVCYPEGTRSELSIEVARRYYAYGLLMNGQLYNTSDDPMRVKRFYVPRGYDLGSFRWSVQDAGTSRNW